MKDEWCQFVVMCSNITAVVHVLQSGERFRPVNCHEHDLCKEATTKTFTLCQQYVFIQPVLDIHGNLCLFHSVPLFAEPVILKVHIFTFNFVTSM